MIPTALRKGFIANSQPGDTWGQSRPLDYPPSPIVANFEYVVSTSFGVIVVNSAGYIAKCTDGVRWTFHSELATHLTSINYGTIRGVGWSGTHLIVLTSNGFYQCSSSTDGITWASTTPPVWSVLRLVRATNALLLIGGHSGLSGNPIVVFTITDGMSWPYAQGLNTALAGSNISGAGYGDGKLLVATEDRALHWSTDYITWSKRTSVLTYQIAAIARTSSHFVYISTQGQYGQSADLVSFSAGSMPAGWGTGFDAGPADLIWLGNRLHAIGLDGRYAIAPANPLASGWRYVSTLRASPFNLKTIRPLAPLGELLIAVGGSVAVSPATWR